MAGLASTNLRERREALVAVVDTLTWKGARKYRILEPGQEAMLATRVTAEALRLLSGTPKGSPAPWPTLPAVEALSGYSNATRRVLAERLEAITDLLGALDRHGQRSVLGVLANLGQLADPATRALIEVLEGEDAPMARHAAYTLGRIGGENAKSYLRRALGAERVRDRALAYWAWMHLSAQVSLQEVRQVAAGLRDGDRAVREAAAKALLHQHWEVFQTDPDGVTLDDLVVSELLVAPEEDVRCAACRLLGLVGESGGSRAPDLARVMIADPSKYVRREAAKALTIVDPSGGGVEHLVGALEEESDDSVRFALIQSIRALAVYAGPFRERLRAEAQRDEQGGKRSLARLLHRAIESIPTGTPR